MMTAEDNMAARTRNCYSLILAIKYFVVASHLATQLLILFISVAGRLLNFAHMNTRCSSMVAILLSLRIDKRSITHLFVNSHP